MINIVSLIVAACVYVLVYELMTWLELTLGQPRNPDLRRRRDYREEPSQRIG